MGNKKEVNWGMVSLVMALIFSIIFFGTWVGMACTVGYQYDKDTSAHIQSALDARSVDYAIEQINETIKGMERNGLTNDSHSALIFKNEENSMNNTYNQLYGIQYRLTELKNKEIRGNYTLLDYTYEFQSIKNQISELNDGEIIVDACYIQNNYNTFAFMIFGMVAWFFIVFGSIFFAMWWDERNW